MKASGLKNVVNTSRLAAGCFISLKIFVISNRWGQIGVVYSEPGQHIWLNIEVPDESTVNEAIERSGILDSFPIST